VQYMTERKIW